MGYVLPSSTLFMVDSFPLGLKMTEFQAIIKSEIGKDRFRHWDSVNWDLVSRDSFNVSSYGYY
jgi:hypothetical protein